MASAAPELEFATSVSSQSQYSMERVFRITPPVLGMSAIEDQIVLYRSDAPVYVITATMTYAPLIDGPRGGTKVPIEVFIRLNDQDIFHFEVYGASEGMASQNAVGISSEQYSVDCELVSIETSDLPGYRRPDGTPTKKIDSAQVRIGVHTKSGLYHGQ